MMSKGLHGTPTGLNADFATDLIATKRRLSCLDQLCMSTTARMGITSVVKLCSAGARVKTVKSVAVILDQELAFTIKEWLKRVGQVPDLTNISLSDEDRMGYLHQLFNDLLYRLRLGRGDEAPISVIAALAHGRARFAQGYSVAMLVEESRIFEVSTFSTLHLHWRELDQDQLLLDIVIIADEADRQLTEAVRGFTMAQEAV